MGSRWRRARAVDEAGAGGFGAGRTQAEVEELAAAGKDVTELSSQLGKLRGAEAENRAVIERLAHHFARVARQ